MLGNGKQTNIGVLRSLFILVKIRIENISLFNILFGLLQLFFSTGKEKNTKNYTTVIIIFLINNMLKLTLRLSWVIIPEMKFDFNIEETT